VLNARLYGSGNDLLLDTAWIAYCMNIQRQEKENEEKKES
jgi:hypothetical protein